MLVDKATREVFQQGGEKDGGDWVVNPGAINKSLTVPLCFSILVTTAS